MESGNQTGPPKRGTAFFAAFAVGAGALWIQVLLIRRLLAAFSGNELTIGLSLAVWMAGSAAGALLASRFADRVRSPSNVLAGCLALAGGLLVPAVAMTARIKEWLGSGFGEVAGPHQVVAASLLLAFPLAALLGFSFSLCARLQAGFRSAAARAYRAEALGAFASGAVLSVWFFFSTRPLAPAWVLAAALALAALIVIDRGDRSARLALAAAGAALLLAGAGLVAHRSLERLYEKLCWPGREVLASFDSRHGLLAAVRSGDEVTIFADGDPAATFPDPASDEVAAHLPLVMCAKPESVLLIGGGLAGVGREVLRHPVGRLDYAALDPAWIGLEERFAPGFAAVASDPRVQVLAGDPRARVRQSPAAYDVVIVNLADPLTASLARFSSLEFLGEVRAALRPGGVVALFAGETPPNRMLTPAQLDLLAGTMKTVDAVFAARVILPLGRNLIVAGDRAADLTTDPVRIQAALDRRGIKSFYAGASMIGPDLDPVSMGQLELKLQASSAPLSTDFHPRGYLTGIRLWAERGAPSFARRLEGLGRAPAWSIVFAPLLVLAAGMIGGRRDAAAALVAAGSCGFVSIVAAVSLMVAFQVAAGAVYFALSLLTAAMMVGLWAGARLAERADGRWTLAVTLLALCLAVVLAMAATWTLRGAGFGLAAMSAIFSLLVFMVGAAGGSLFAAAARAATPSRDRVGGGAGAAYGADLAGGALGGLMAGALLIPVFGIMGALATALMVSAAALAVVLIAAR